MATVYPPFRTCVFINGHVYHCFILYLCVYVPRDTTRDEKRQINTQSNTEILQPSGQCLLCTRVCKERDAKYASITSFSRLQPTELLNNNRTCPILIRPSHGSLFLRFFITIDQFQHKYDRWPKRVRLSSQTIDAICETLTAPCFTALMSRVRLIPDKAVGMSAEDDEGREWDTTRDSHYRESPGSKTLDWLNQQQQEHCPPAVKMLNQNVASLPQPLECSPSFHRHWLTPWQ